MKMKVIHIHKHKYLRNIQNLSKITHLSIFKIKLLKKKIHRVLIHRVLNKIIIVSELISKLNLNVRTTKRKYDLFL